VTIDIAKLVDAERGDRPSVQARGRKIRIVCRLDRTMVERLDAIRRTLRPSRPFARAAVIRASVALLCALAEEQHPPAATP
jgi:hypothetical protein